MISGYLASVWAPRLVALLLSCLTLGFTARASADESLEARVRSLSLFKESAAHYEAGRYSVAAALLEEAYALYPEPKLLYNLGRARESGGELKRAVEAYEAYLRSEPATERHAAVQQHIEELKARSALSPEVERGPDLGLPPDNDASPEPSQARPQQAQAAPTAKGPDGSGSRTVPWILVGSGGAVLAAALTVGLIARAGHREAKAESVQSKAVKLQHAAERQALIANVLAGAGGALAVAGAAWLVFGGRDEPQGKQGRSRGHDLASAWHLGPSGLHYSLSF